MHHHSWTRTLGITVIAAFAASLASAEVKIGDKAPQFKLKDLSGKTYDLSDHTNKVVVLEWWNQDCPWTVRYTDTMKKLADKYEDRGVVWLAIDSTHYQTVDKNKEYHDKHNLPYPILMDNDGDVGRAYGAKTTPHMFVIHDGKVVYNGGIDDRGDRNYVAEALDAVLAGKTVSMSETKPFGCTVKYAKDKPMKAEVGKQAPAFKLKDLTGTTYDLSEHGDKVIVLEWWNQDCPVTRQHTDTMNRLAKEYAPKGVVWLAVDSTHYQTVDKNKTYHKKHNMPYPVLMDNDGKVGKMYEAKTTPHMFVINKGKLVYDGAIDDRGSRNYIEEVLDAVLAGKDVPVSETKPYGCSVKYKQS